MSVGLHKHLLEAGGGRGIFSGGTKQDQKKAYHIIFFTTYLVNYVREVTSREDCFGSRAPQVYKCLDALLLDYTYAVFPRTLARMMEERLKSNNAFFDDFTERANDEIDVPFTDRLIASYLKARRGYETTSVNYQRKQYLQFVGDFMKK